MPDDLNWFIPSFYGDLRVERVDDGSCRLLPENLSEAEKVAVRAVLSRARKPGWGQAPWWDGDADLVVSKCLEVVLSAPIEKVAKALAKAMKPGRKVLSVVKVTNGSVEEVHEVTSENVKKARVATSVAAPTRGCPAPVFDPSELRAQRVLKAFLSPAQVDDFDRRQSFVTTGATTGHRYAVTSRLANDSLARYRRSLFDLDEGRAYCVHDWDVPPAEEMLALHIFLRVHDGEAYLRDVPDDGRLHVATNGMMAG